MALSLVLYAGVIISFIGALYAFRLFRAGLLLLFVGLILIVVALAIPARSKRVAQQVTLLDNVMPEWQFSERHSITIDAPAADVFEAVRAVRANEIFLFRTLTAIRRMGRAGPESILNAPETIPILDVATRTSFLLLGNKPPHEIVIGARVVKPLKSKRLVREDFYRAGPPGAALAVMNFHVTPDGAGRSVLTTETRVFANTPRVARRFATYWRFILPGSDIIRRSWLRAIKRRAES